MKTRVEASFLATLTPETDPSEGAWRDYHRYGYESTPLMRPSRLRVMVQLSGGKEGEGWAIRGANAELVSSNVKKNGEIGERMTTTYLFGELSEAYVSLIEQVVRAAKQRFNISEES